MTDAQLDAITKAKEILSEHFEGYVIVVQADEGDKEESNQTFWDGGYALAWGLIQCGNNYFQKNQGTIESS